MWNGYDCVPHNLLLAKFQAYCFSRESIRLFSSYLTNRTQKIKFQFIILGSTGPYTLQIGDITIKSPSSVTLLSITIYSKFNFKEHSNNIVKKVYYKLYKLYTLTKLLKLLILEKAKILACSMIESQFAYCSLIRCSTEKQIRKELKGTIFPISV